ncbi:MAG: acetamidase/formamidase family protein [Synergistaceae bacterium]|jgi:amidase|nr:acetamidase/formamidase family protein [Synergistaceae bacterium]
MKFLSAAQHIYAYEPEMKGVAEVSPGDSAVFETQDCFAGQIQTEETLCADIDFDHVNPATGPLHVVGAEKNDLLGVLIESIETADRAASVVVPGAGVMPDRVEASLTRILEIDGKNRRCSFRGLNLPLKPMIGVIGVATASERVPTGTPGSHGGNMDTTDITEKSVLWLPVFQKGALLALGDCHAVMGDGEIGCSGAEVAAKVTVRLDLLKQAAFPWPILVTPRELMIIASAETLDLAARTASEAMVQLVEKTLGLSMSDALILCSLVMDLRISQVVDPQKTVRAVMPLEILPWEKVRATLTAARGLW